MSAKFGKISIQNACKVYDPEGVNVCAVDNCSLEIAAGEFCMVVGPSGCGKTTLLNALAGFHGISSGEIHLDGQLLCAADYLTPPGADRIVVFQNGALFPWYTVEQNVTFGPVVQGRLTPPQARKAAAELLGELGLRDIAQNYPGELSSGMKRRVEIARALLNDPKVLLLDEPFRAMDALTKGVVHEFLLQVYDKMPKTIFFITHDLEEAMFLGSKVVIMTTRPCQVKKVIEVDLPRPRGVAARSSPRYRELRNQVVEAVHEEARKAFEAGERELA
ncbi:MAG: ABC transporter ATP-binding protein [Deltaproteobacteria bacterium]|nr:ABC transporter ATP-binding protein [Deltaproteobacteria bacterium]